MHNHFSLKILLRFLLLFLPVTATAQSWQFVESPTIQNLARLDMLSDQAGYAVSYDGLILSYDGQIWSITDSLQQIAQRTSVGYDSMQAVNAVQGDIYTIRMTSEAQGWLAVNESTLRQYSLLHYANDEWLPIHPALQVKIRAIDFAGPDFGMAVGEKGGYRYEDGTWRLLNLPCSMDFRCVKIVSPEHIFICGEKGTILKGGAAWEVLPLPTPVLLRDMDFIDENLGWIVGNSGTILRYEDGELIPEFAETSENLWGIDMLSPAEGYIVGQNGLILQYDGASWQVMSSPTRADLHDIEMVDNRNGFIVGAWGAILQYRDDERSAHAPQFILVNQVHLGSKTLMDRIKDVLAVTAADFNGDGKSDLYLTCPNSLNHLLLNRGDGYFTDFVIESGTGGSIETRVGSRRFESGALAADFDRDEDIDLLLCGRRETTRYFVNDGSARFTDQTNRSRLPRNLNIIDGSLTDFENDGHPDLVMADEELGLRLFRNIRYNRFEELHLSRLHLPATGIRAVKCADFNQDNTQDILIMYRHMAPIVLFALPGLHWNRVDTLFETLSHANFVTSVTTADFNADGHTDLFVCSEDGQDALYLYEPQRRRFLDRSSAWRLLRGGRSYCAVAADWNLDGCIDIYLSRYGEDYLYLNQNNASFIQAAQEHIYSKAGYLNGYTTGAVMLDIDANRAPDLMVGNLEFWSSLLQNRTSPLEVIEVRLHGIRATREALGSKIRVWPAGADKERDQPFHYSEVALSSGLFCQNSASILIAPGGRKSVDIAILFPNGQQKVIDLVPAGSLVEVSDTAAGIAWFYRSGRAFNQFLHIPQVPYELLKLLLYTLIIVAGVRFTEKRYHWRPTRLTIYVIGLVLIYILLSYFLSGTGWAYHALPFVMLFFGFLVLISVNEPMRKNAVRQQFIQRQIQESSNQLARTLFIDKAVEIIIRTLRIIPSFHQFAFYLYFPDGNYFLLKECAGVNRDQLTFKFSLDRGKIAAGMQRCAPLDKAAITALGLPHELQGDSLAFPLLRKDQVLGVVLLGVTKTPNGNYEADRDAYTYLFLQLSIVLDNLRIVRDLQEQQKLVAVGTFASSIIHNLKNPIEGIRLMVEMLTQDLSADDPRRELLQELQSGIQRLREMLGRSFEFLKYDSQTQQALSLDKMLREVIRSLKGPRPETIQFLPVEEEIWIHGNPEQLKYAFENLLQNAVEAGGSTAMVEVHCDLNQENGTAVICIRDWGAGIAAEDLDHIFDLYYSTRGRGRGLGLAITRHIVKNHGGFIDVHSDAQSGTEFRVTLPINQEEQADETASHSG